MADAIRIPQDLLPRRKRIVVGFAGGGGTRFGIVLLPDAPPEGELSAQPTEGVRGSAQVGEDSALQRTPSTPSGSPSPYGGGVAFIVDIGMRMLDPETELARAMGWPASYRLSVDAAGRKVTKTTITKLVGNGVCKAWAEAHIRANCAALPWWGEPAREAA